jgi:hypothetical protein
MTSKKDEKDEENDLRGFEDFLKSHEENNRFLPRPSGTGSRRQESNFSRLTFLTNDRNRLMRTKILLNEKINLMSRFNQSEALLSLQESEKNDLKKKIFDLSDHAESPYRKSLREVFDVFFSHF